MGIVSENYQATLTFLKGNKVFMFLVVSLFGGNIYQALPSKILKNPEAVVKHVCDCSLLKKEVNKLKRWHP